MIESTLEPLFHISSLPKTWTIAEVGTNFVISNSNLEGESISLYESICDESTGLDFGRCSSARFSFTTLDIDLELAGRIFDVSFTFEDEPNTPFVVGRFKVVEDKPSPDRRNRDVVMYDALYDVLNTNYASWYNGLTWTGMTLGGFIDSFLSHVGITAETSSRAELVNASMTVEKTLQTNELTGSTILHAVCEIAGCFGVMTRDNKFRFLYLKSDIEGLYPANDLYPAEDLYPVEPAGTLIDGSEYFPPLVYETYKAPSISKLFISESADSLGTVVGSGDVEYDIVGNFLLFGKGATELNTIGLNTLSAISSRMYRPFSVSKMGNLCFELGDPVRMSNERISVESYILSRTFSGTQGFTDDISAEGTQDYNTVANTASASVQQLNSKTLKLRQDVDEVSTTMTEELALDGVVRQGTYAYQTNNKIGAKVDIEYGNHTTDSFSWDMDITGHAWYKGNQQVMKIDGNGLSVKGAITAGSTIKGASFECVDANDNRTTWIAADGGWAEFAEGRAKFVGGSVNSKAEFTTQYFSVDLDDSGSFSVDCQNGGKALLIEEEYSPYTLTYSQGIYIGCDELGTVGVNKAAMNGSEWVHIGVNTPDVRIGGTDGTTTDVRIQADTNAHIKFRYTINKDTPQETVATTTLADLMSGISTALSNASSAASSAASAQSDVNLAFTAINSLSDDIRALEAEARNHGWNV